jgi:polyisoprenoid-binding protein YceI
MHKKTLMVMLIVTALILLVSACGLLQEPEEASAPISATPLAAATKPGDPVMDAPDAEIEEDTIETEEPQSEDGQDTGQAAPGALTVYQISQADSEVRFELDEDLRGVRTTVVGTTDQVAGEIAIDPSDLSTAQVGVIQINARTLTTDNNFRNRAIQNEILKTGEFEFITFAPISISGLPDSAGVGEVVSFTIEGEMTIRDVTNPVEFTVDASVDSAGRLVGTATAVVQRAEYGLKIPSVPNVANVEEEVELYIEFVAIAS